MSRSNTIRRALVIDNYGADRSFMEELGSRADCMSLPSDIDDDLCANRAVTVHQARSCSGGTAPAGKPDAREARYFAKPHIFVRPSTDQLRGSSHHDPHTPFDARDEEDDVDCGGGGGGVACGGDGGGEVVLLSGERCQRTPPPPPRPPQSSTATPTAGSPYRNAHSTPGHAYSSPDHGHYAALPSFRSNKHTENDGGGPLTLVVSSLVALLVAMGVFAACYYYAGLDAPVSAAISVIGAWIPLTFALCASIACRCIASCCLCSIVGTSAGRLFLLGVITSLLIQAPILNSLGRVYNCGSPLVPYESMMSSLQKTSDKVGVAWGDEKRGVPTGNAGLPVSMGIRSSLVEQHMRETRSLLHKHTDQLKGVPETCRRLVEEAHSECLRGLQDAVHQCAKVIESFADVYRQTKLAIDLINPDRLSGPKLQTLFKRQSAVAHTEPPPPPKDSALPHKNLCRPLMESTSCQRLNDTSRLCTPVTWSSQYLGGALNRTADDIRMLQRQIARAYGPHRSQLGEPRVSQATLTRIFLALTWISRGLLLLFFLFVYASYKHLRRFLCDDRYFNDRIGDQVKRLDRSRQTLGRCSLLPLRRHELQFLHQRTTSRPYRGHVVGTPCILLHACLMVALCLLCVLNVQWCNEWQASVTQCTVAACLYVTCLVGVVTQNCSTRVNVNIASWFYPKRARQRADWLVDVIVGYKKDVRRHISEKARINRFKREGILSLRHQLACGKATCDIGSTECLVCGLKVSQYANCSVGTGASSGGSQASGSSGEGGGGGGGGGSKNCFVDCVRCCSVYCDQCYSDVGEQCPLCYQVSVSPRETSLYWCSSGGGGGCGEKRTALRGVGPCLVGDPATCRVARHQHATTRSSVCLPSECGRNTSSARVDGQTYSSASICGHKNIYDCQQTTCAALL